MGLNFYDSLKRKRYKEVKKRPQRQKFNDEFFNPMNTDMTSGYRVSKRIV